MYSFKVAAERSLADVFRDDNIIIIIIIVVVVYCSETLYYCRRFGLAVAAYCKNINNKRF